MSGAGDIGCAIVARRVAESYYMSVDDILGRDRTKSIAEARAVAFVVARAVLQRSYPELAKAFKRDHGTVMVACRRVAKRIDDDALFAARVGRIMRVCREELVA
jgi:chromosomal replication initiator protein